MSRCSLDPADIAMYDLGQAGGRPTARVSRAHQLRGYTMTRQHTPTGVEVHGAIPHGKSSRQEMRHGKSSRQEMRRLKDTLYSQLYRALEQAVA